MLNKNERQLVYDQGYLPEHLFEYVEAVSLSEPFLHESYLLFFKHGHMTFIGYPLGQSASSPSLAYETACKRFDPATVSIMAPDLWFKEKKAQETDYYYVMELPISQLNQDNAYMIRRASKELTLKETKISRDHKRLIKSFTEGKDLSGGQKSIYESIPKYLRRSDTARLIEARKGADLVAFNVLDLGTWNYGMYMFNIRSLELHVPGASDLLLHGIAQMSHNEGKKYLNMGLGISPGIRRFKEKWGAKKAWTHQSINVKLKEVDLMGLLKR